MSADASQPWSCPQCERRVPARQDVCHCGFDRRRWPAARKDVAAGTEAPTADGNWRLWAALAGVIVLGVAFAALTQREGPAAPGSGPARAGASGYPPLPVAGPGGEPSAEAPPTEVSGAEEGAPAGTPELVLPTLAPAPESRPSALATPTPTAMEVARQQAMELLEPLIRPISRQADLLDLRFRYYIESCRPDFRGGPRPGASRYWFILWTDAAQLAWKEDEIPAPVSAQADGSDCRITWIEVLEGARSVGTELEAFEETARTNSVLPGHVEVLLAAHRLSGWREHFEKRRRRE
jgi:hypothetical protein